MYNRSSKFVAGSLDVTRNHLGTPIGGLSMELVCLKYNLKLMQTHTNMYTTNNY